MGARIADNLLAVLREQLDRDGVAHRAGWDEERRFLAGDLGRALFEFVCGWVFGVDVIAHFGFEHRLAHGRRGFRDRVAAEIDHTVRNSWNISFEIITPLGVRRRLPFARSNMPVERKYSNIEPKRCQSALSA